MSFEAQDSPTIRTTCGVLILLFIVISVQANIHMHWFRRSRRMYEAESRSSQKFKQTLQGIQREMLPVLSEFWIALVNIGRNRAAILPGQNMFLTDWSNMSHYRFTESGINSDNTLVSLVTLVLKEIKVILVMKLIVVGPQISSLWPQISHSGLKSALPSLLSAL